MSLRHAHPYVLSTMTALLLTLAGCGRRPAESTEAGATTAPLPPVTVTVAPAQTEPRQQTDTVVGTVRPKRSAKIAAQLNGVIAQFPVTIGSTVKQGDLLVQVDAKEIQAQLDQAVAGRDKVEKDLARTRQLVEQKMAAQQELDDLQAAVTVAKAKVTEIQTLFGYTKLTAPFDGVVTTTMADKGDLATPGKPLLELEDPATLRLEAFVPEAIVGSLKTGREYAVKIDGADFAAQAMLTEIAPTADPSSRTFLAKFDLPAVAGKLRSGQFGRVQIPVAVSEVLRVPAAAVVTRGQMELVFVVNARSQAELRLVKTGKRDSERIDILSGVAAGERVITSGAAGLADRQPVAVAEGAKRE